MIIPAIARFLADYRRALGTRRFLVACSGGPDSVALAASLRRVAAESSITVVLGHVNHGLRGRSSEADARFVGELGRRLGWRTVITNARPPGKGNLEEQLRDERYRLLARVARRHHCGAVLTAHTRNDQVETVLMNLARGTGPEGLAGMKPVRMMEGTLIRLGRPLLRVERKDVLSFLKAERLRFRTDRSNVDPRFFRNWLRSSIVPQFERRAPGFVQRVEQLADLARGDGEFWNVFLADLESRLLTRKGPGRLLDSKGLLRYSPAVQRRFLRRVIGRDLLTFETIERLQRWMSGPATNGRIFQMRKGWTAERLSKSQGSPSATLFWFRQTKIDQ